MSKQKLNRSEVWEISHIHLVAPFLWFLSAVFASFCYIPIPNSKGYAVNQRLKCVKCQNTNTDGKARRKLDIRQATCLQPNLTFLFPNGGLGYWDPISSLMKRDLRNTGIKNKTDPEIPG